MCEEEYWAVADVHCAAFYPRAAFWTPFLRLDRVAALQVGGRNEGAGEVVRARRVG